MTAGIAEHQLMKYIAIAMTLILLLALLPAGDAEAQGTGATPSPSASMQGGPVDVLVYVSPNKVGKVTFYDESGKLAATGEVGKVIGLKPGAYKIEVISKHGIFCCWKGEKLFHTDPLSPEVIVLQKRVINWPLIIVLALLLVSGTAAFIFRDSILKKIQAPKKAEDPLKTLTGSMPQLIGPYTFVERLGQGGMATVYKVKDRYGDFYALKVPHPHIFNIPEFRARFIREAEIIKTLHHPNIVRLFDYGRGEDGETPYICMEFVTGKSLRDFIDENPVLPVARVVKIVSEIAGALGYAHSKGIIHRDVKPENVMMASNGVLKLMDLGIARATDKKTLTATGTTLGTPHYIAPEQVEVKSVDGRADLYSLGVILYQMLTARLPFDAEEPVSIIIMHVSEEPEPPSKHNALIPAGLEAIVMKLLEKEPHKRFQTAEELIEALKKFA